MNRYSRRWVGSYRRRNYRRENDCNPGVRPKRGEKYGWDAVGVQHTYAPNITISRHKGTENNVLTRGYFMAMTFAVNPDNNDIFINRNGSLQVVYGVEEVRQRILIALQHNWNEYFLNVPAGVPWYEVILGSKDKRTAELILRKTILDVPGVVSILKLFTLYESRKFSLYATVEVAGLESTQVVNIIQDIIE